MKILFNNKGSANFVSVTIYVVTQM